MINFVITFLFCKNEPKNKKVCYPCQLFCYELVCYKSNFHLLLMFSYTFDCDNCLEKPNIKNLCILNIILSVMLIYTVNT